jgi:hypothetical protein
MKQHDQLKKSYSKIKTEAILRSVILSFSIGFSLGFITFIIGLITTQNLLWLGLSITLLVSISTGLFIYIYALHPTPKTVAERLDELGLEERTITMIELEGKDTYIANIQRKDTYEKINTFTPNKLRFKSFTKPLVMFFLALTVMSISLAFMITKVNAANNEPELSTEIPLSREDEILQEMIENLLSIINNANIDPILKNTLYGMVIDLSNRLPQYDTYIEKYTDILNTRNEILRLIAEAIQDIEDSLMNIAEALQQYENTEILGLAIATWNDNAIIDAFNYMYERIDVLLGQELYDVMLQTALDIESALAESVGTDPGMHQALQDLADAYKLAIDGFDEKTEEEVLEQFREGMEESLQALLDAIQALRDLIEELLELEEEINEELEQVDQFPIFMPWPEEDQSGGDPGTPNNPLENTVIDGQTPYKDIFDEYLENAMNYLTLENMSEEMRRIIENYFRMLS